MRQVVELGWGHFTTSQRFLQNELNKECNRARFGEWARSATQLCVHQSVRLSACVLIRKCDARCWTPCRWLQVSAAAVRLRRSVPGGTVGGRVCSGSPSATKILSLKLFSGQKLD